VSSAVNVLFPYLPGFANMQTVMQIIARPFPLLTHRNLGLRTVCASDWAFFRRGELVGYGRNVSSKECTIGVGSVKK
jgi:hypothetical protein